MASICHAFPTSRSNRLLQLQQQLQVTVHRRRSRRMMTPKECPLLRVPFPCCSFWRSKGKGGGAELRRLGKAIRSRSSKGAASSDAGEGVHSGYDSDVPIKEARNLKNKMDLFSYCGVLVDDHTMYTWVYTVKNKPDVFDVLNKLYADTAITLSKHPLCCFCWDNAGENFAAAMLKMDDWQRNQFVNINSTRTLAERQGRIQIRVLCNIAWTNMMASGLVQYSMQLISWTSNIELISKCLHVRSYLDLSGWEQMSALLLGMLVVCSSRAASR